MTDLNLERSGPDSEVYIAGNARILKAMQRAVGSLVGMTVEVVPVTSGTDEVTNPAVTAAVASGVRLYEGSGNEYLHPQDRDYKARMGINYYGGGVVAVEFDPEGDPVSQRELFLARTIDYLLYQAESPNGESLPDPSGIETEEDLDEFLRQLFLGGLSASEELSRMGVVAEDTGVEPDAPTVERLEAAIEHGNIVRDGMAAREEIGAVNNASVGR